MKLLLLSVLLISNVCCGEVKADDFVTPYMKATGKDPRTNMNTNKEFADYVTLFENITGEDVEDIPINFGSMEKGSNVNTVAQCRAWTAAGVILYAEVIVKESYWIKASNNSRETLILHELGHCSLARPHTKELMVYGEITVPKSLMHPFNVGEHYYYSPNRIHYLTEMNTYAKEH